MILQISALGAHVFLFLGKIRFQAFVAEKGEAGGQRHAQRDNGRQYRCFARIQQTETAGKRKQHKAEFTRLPTDQRRVQADRVGDTADPAQNHGDQGLEDDQSDQQA